MNGLLNGERRDDSNYFSLGRAQLLVSTTVVAVTYVRHLISNPEVAVLPDLSSDMVKLLICSHVFYLIGKARALWFDPNPSNR